ncbi:MAG: hypothetical protein R6U39_02480 [Candidatus Aegiribacteria sp.]
MMSCLIITLLLLSGQEAEEELKLDHSVLVQARAWGDWTEDKMVSLDSTSLDAAFSVSVESKELDLLAVAAVDGGEPEAVALRRGRFSVRWPGTPWLGGSVHLNDRQPFIPGLREPIAEWGWVDADSIRGFGVSGGGILGFEAEYLLQHAVEDTVEQLSIFSPWMGFAGFDYYRARLVPGDSLAESETVVNVLSFRGDLRYASPWLVISGSDGEKGSWAVSGEMRDYRPIETGWGKIELVPGIHFAGDSIDLPTTAYAPGQRVFTLGAFMTSRRYMVSGGVTGRLDLESDSLSGFSATASMVSSRGVTWDLVVDIFADGDHRGAVGSRISDSFASAGLSLEVIDDSSRVTGSTSYSPREDVCAEVSVSGDLDNSLQPSTAVAVSAAVGPVRGLISVDWVYHSAPVFRIDLRGLLK